MTEAEYADSLMRQLKKMQLGCVAQGTRANPLCGASILIACLTEALGTTMVLIPKPAQAEVLKQLAIYTQAQNDRFDTFKPKEIPNVTNH